MPSVATEIICLERIPVKYCGTQSEVIGAFIGRELIEELAARFPEGIHISKAGAFEQPIELEEHEFDRIEVWAVRGLV